MPDRISVNGTELEYQLRGTGAGEPVVLIHWGVAATWAEPLLDQPATGQPLPAAQLSPGRLRRQRPATRPAHHGRARRPLPSADARARHHQSPHRRPLLQRPGSTPARAGRPRSRAHPHPHGGRPARPAHRHRAAVRHGRRPGRPPALPRGRQGRSGRHLLPRRLRTRLPGRARPRATRGLQAGSRRRRHVLHPGNTRHPAVAVHRRRRAPHPAASTRRPRDSQPRRCSRNGRSCCCTGCPTPSHSTCPASPTSCTRRTPPPSPTD